METKIEKGIPLPNIIHGRYDFSKFEINDSQFFDTYPSKIYQAIVRWIKKNKSSSKFIVRPYEQDGIKGCRIWRIK